MSSPREMSSCPTSVFAAQDGGAYGQPAARAVAHHRDAARVDAQLTRAADQPGVGIFDRYRVRMLWRQPVPHGQHRDAGPGDVPRYSPVEDGHLIAGHLLVLDDVLAYLDGNRRALAEFLDEHLPGVGTPSRRPRTWPGWTSATWVWATTRGNSSAKKRASSSWTGRPAASRDAGTPGSTSPPAADPRTHHHEHGRSSADRSSLTAFS
jgi:hypothetical protein